MVINGDSLIQSDSMNYGCFTYGRQGIVILPDNYNDGNFGFSIRVYLLEKTFAWSKLSII